MKIYDATLSSGTDPVYSTPIVMSEDKGFSIAIVWAGAGTLTATVTLQLGVKLPHEDGGGYAWGDSTETFPAVPANDSGTSVQSWDYQNADAVRLKITRASGSGTFKAFGKVK